MRNREGRGNRQQATGNRKGSYVHTGLQSGTEGQSGDFRIPPFPFALSLFRAFAISLPLIVLASACQAQMALPNINIGVGRANSPEQVSTSLQILLVMTVLSLAPALLIMLTSFTRIVIILSFTRSAIGSPQVPPNTVLVGLALFLTFFTMAPVLQKINQSALQPYMEHRMSFQDATDKASSPLRDFMLKQTRPKDIALFVNLSKAPRPKTKDDLQMHVIIPAFLISELKTAFTIGFVIFVPFLVIDMVVSVTLMSMGMMMLPPVMISMPFKILLFVLVDGWHLIVRSIALSFH
ncbi:MAG: flagellar type III secretion system pore protein FliP [Armatimonadetes bacterium]|nr:flagellar type III secretion system pore protein FliP [Armatimonadota bacterium]